MKFYKMHTANEFKLFDQKNQKDKSRYRLSKVGAFGYGSGSMAEQKNSGDLVRSLSAMTMADDILGCKWSLMVLQLVRQGICRPGQMERSVEGLTTKVLNERL